MAARLKSEFHFTASWWRIKTSASPQVAGILQKLSLPQEPTENFLPSLFFIAMFIVHINFPHECTTSFDDNGLWSKLEFSSDSLEQRIAQNLENSLELQKYSIQVLVLSNFVQWLQGESSLPWSVASFDQHARGYSRARHCKIPWWRHAPVHK